MSSYTQNKLFKWSSRVTFSAAICQNILVRFETDFDVITVRPHVDVQVRAGGGLLDAGGCLSNAIRSPGESFLSLWSSFSAQSKARRVNAPADMSHCRQEGTFPPTFHSFSTPWQRNVTERASMLGQLRLTFPPARAQVSWNDASTRWCLVCLQLSIHF